MKSVRLRNRKIVVAEVSEPQITSPTQVKIRIAYASICGYELMIYKGTTGENPNDSLGHEASGIVTEVGSQVSAIRVGDRVTLNPYSACGYCENCMRGLPSYCMNLSLSVPAFMSEYVILEQTQVLTLPVEMSLLDGCLIEPLSVCLRAIEKAKLSYNRNLLIIGGGAMGLLTLQAAQLHPVEKIVVLEPSPEKRRMARELGATITLDPNSEDVYFHLMDCTRSMGFDAIIEASGNSQCVSLGFNVLARGGDLVLLSMYEQDYFFDLRPLSLYWKDASIQAVYPASNFFPRTVSLARRLSLSRVVTGVYPYQEASQAFDAKCSDPRHAKVVLRFFDE